MLHILVTTAFGLEELLVKELTSIIPGCETQQKPGQVRVACSLKDAYKICLWSRLGNRVLLQLAQGKMADVQGLYDIAKEVDWSSHFRVQNTFAVDFFGTNRQIKNTQFGAVKVKDAIVDQFSKKSGFRPNVDKKTPHVRIQARLNRDIVAIYLDLSGASLHQRHYRTERGVAPIRENLAFAMLMRSGWVDNNTLPIVDPMCGSGTLAIEAALYSRNIAPGLSRNAWGFHNWLGHQSDVWEDLVSEAHAEQKTENAPIFASDVDNSMVQLAKQNAKRAGVDSAIVFETCDALEHSVDVEKPGYMVSNTPYGERLSQLTSLIPLFQKWGLQLKQHFAHWQLALLTSNRDLFRQLRLVSKKAYKLKNANLDCELVLFDMDARNCEVLDSEQGQHNDFANRLKKNKQKSDKWLKKQDINCYRIYDADLPEYNVAIDCYDDWVVVQEYAAPKDIPEHKTVRRLHEVLAVLPDVLSVDAEKIVLKVREVKKGKNQYEKLDQSSELLQVFENGAKFWVNLHDYLDTGLFLDHRITRQKVRQLSKDKRVLNLFAYTGSVSVFAALGGAKTVTTVDMSNTYLDWAKNNFKLNSLRYGYHFIKADCTSWLQKHNEKYDLIFIDPPSFSNSKSMEGTWDVQRDHVQLITDAKRCLAKGGQIIFSNNYRNFKLDESIAESLGLRIENISKATIPEDFKRNQKIHHCWLFTAVEE